MKSEMKKNSPFVEFQYYANNQCGKNAIVICQFFARSPSGQELNISIGMPFICHLHALKINTIIHKFMVNAWKQL